MNDFVSELKNFERAMAEAKKQTETASSEHAQYAAIDPPNGAKNCIGHSCVQNQQDSLTDRPIGIRMVEAEDNSFEITLLSERILSSLCSQPEMETPKRSSDTMKECADNLYGNTKLTISILKKILKIIGADE